MSKGIKNCKGLSAEEKEVLIDLFKEANVMDLYEGELILYLQVILQRFKKINLQNKRLKEGINKLMIELQ